MRGIDVYQGEGTNHHLPLKAIPQKAYKESDFVIVKSTQGTSYKYTDFFYELIEKALKDGKLCGAYHYAGGGDPIKEADYFLKVVKKYIGKIILCLDWEGYQNSKFGSKTWCKSFIDRVKEKTGVTCFLYTGTDGCNQNSCLVGKVPLWFAGYPKPMSTSWTVPKWKYNLGKWGVPAIWQYTSSNEKIDRNTSGLTKKQWFAYAKGEPVKKEKASKTESEMRSEVVDNLAMLKGIKEGSSEHKMIIDTFNKSGLCTRYKMTTKDAWCATAVSFAFIINKLAGKPGSGALFQCVECSCTKMIELAKKQGIWVEKDNYIPKMGDVIMYDWQDSGNGDNTGSPDHTGIVEKTENKVISIIEGNYQDSIKERKIAVNGKNIRGFIVPKYSEYAVKEDDSKNKVEADKPEYYPKYTGKSNSIVDALKSLGVKNPSFDMRAEIANNNGIRGYTGLAAQNNELMTLLKTGKLKK